MNDSISKPHMLGDTPTLPPSEWTKQTRQLLQAEARQERAAFSPVSRGGWVGGLILILLGIIYLAHNIWGAALGLWALLLLIPAMATFGSAYSEYRSEGRMTACARGPLIGGIVLLLLAGALFLNLNFNLIWPAFMVLGGALLFFNGLVPD